MLKLKDILNENKKNNINESFGVADALLLSLIQGGIGLGIGAMGVYLMHGGIDKIKEWWKEHKDNKEVKKIVAKLKNDSEIKSFLQNPKQKGWRELVKKKLSGNELEYLNKISKNKINL